MHTKLEFVRYDGKRYIFKEPDNDFPFIYVTPTICIEPHKSAYERYKKEKRLKRLEKIKNATYQH